MATVTIRRMRRAGRIFIRKRRPVARRSNCVPTGRDHSSWGMPEAAKKNAQWTPVVANTRAIRGAIEACLKLSDQLSDHELKGEAMGFVNEMDYLAAQLLGERTRVKPKRSSENELLQRL